MKLWRAIWTGALGGALLSAALAVAGWLLGLDRAPWRWAVPAGDANVLDVGWGAIVAVLLTGAAVLGAGAALVSALIFEFVTRRAGWLIGAITGALHGTLAAAAVGLLPWLATRSGRSPYPLDAATLPAHHDALALATLVVAGVAFGAFVGARYGRPRHEPETDARVWWRELHPTARRFL